MRNLTVSKKNILSLAKARYRATQGIGVVNAVRNSEGAILRKPGEIRRGWKEYFDELLNEEFARKNSSQSEATAGPINLWSENEVRGATVEMKAGKQLVRGSTDRGMEGALGARNKVDHS
uniref:Reverse transcriptase domain-containing protein n=1 Tax=Haemonchus contortus TaxID=6289 RepID=A0A7I4YW76_HAECO